MISRPPTTRPAVTGFLYKTKTPKMPFFNHFFLNNFERLHLPLLRLVHQLLVNSPAFGYFFVFLLKKIRAQSFKNLLLNFECFISFLSVCVMISNRRVFWNDFSFKTKKIRLRQPFKERHLKTITTLVILPLFCFYYVFSF